VFVCDCVLVVRRHVEYAERKTTYGMLFICSLSCEYTNLEYVSIHVICSVRVNPGLCASVF